MITARTIKKKELFDIQAHRVVKDILSKHQNQLSKIPDDVKNETVPQ